MTYSLTGMTTLGSVTRETNVKDAGLFKQPLPATDSSSAILLDLFGAERTITIDGRFVNGTSSKTIAQFIDELEALINGNQSSKTFASDKSGNSFTVLVSTVEWHGDEADESSVIYNITMTEGSL